MEQTPSLGSHVARRGGGGYAEVAAGARLRSLVIMFHSKTTIAARNVKRCAAVTVAKSNRRIAESVEGMGRNEERPAL